VKLSPISWHAYLSDHAVDVVGVSAHPHFHSMGLVGHELMNAGSSSEAHHEWRPIITPLKSIFASVTTRIATETHTPAVHLFKQALLQGGTCYLLHCKKQRHNFAFQPRRLPFTLSPTVIVAVHILRSPAAPSRSSRPSP